jgi:signal recognition particle GTPase
VDEQLFVDLEAVLLSCDVGVEATRYLLEQTRARAQRERMQDATQIRDACDKRCSSCLRRWRNRSIFPAPSPS